MNRIASVVTAAAATSLALATVGAFALTSGISWNSDDDDDHEEREWAERNGLLDPALAATSGTTLTVAGTGAAPADLAASPARSTRESREDRERREHDDHDDDDHDDDDHDDDDDD
ncbi:MAG: hypothetical protein IT302_02375 [Dehalococcoidia bacterium]|nr:hypothetical protein [Dehalococcoidia bacterium]